MRYAFHILPSATENEVRRLVLFSASKSCDLGPVQSSLVKENYSQVITLMVTYPHISSLLMFLS